MTANKTQPTTEDVSAFLARVDDSRKREDVQTIVDMLENITGYSPTMWGDSMIGFGRYEYHYKSGRSGEWMVVGVAPRARNITVYIMPGFKPFEELLSRLGKYKTSQSCLYINRLSDVDISVLKQLMTQSVELMKERYTVVG